VSIHLCKYIPNETDFCKYKVSDLISIHQVCPLYVVLLDRYFINVIKLKPFNKIVFDKINPRKTQFCYKVLIRFCFKRCFVHLCSFENT
jgi:hypothetical protein